MLVTETGLQATDPEWKVWFWNPTAHQMEANKEKQTNKQKQVTNSHDR